MFNNAITTEKEPLYLHLTLTGQSLGHYLPPLSVNLLLCAGGSGDCIQFSLAQLIPLFLFYESRLLLTNLFTPVCSFYIFILF